MDPTRLTVNGRAVEIAAEGATPLLLVLREELGLRATRAGCGAEACGACTVVVDGVARFSCTLPLSDVGGGKRRDGGGARGGRGPRTRS